MVRLKKDTDAAVIGAKIKQLRMLCGMTQEELSEKIGIDNKRLSRIETGCSMPTLKIANELTKIFNFNFYDLINNPSKYDIEIPDNIYVQSLNILHSAQTKQERICYLEALKHTQKCLKLGNNGNT
ncbi:MAG: helix-turn-helix domain-containing protein [Candidatus Gastranaerophilales bacterium]|nr:helix-turn-helix domain-containing protein [Candidatus Gastranaerophilales bacterium]